jgi:hypothetical protein
VDVTEAITTAGNIVFMNIWPYWTSRTCVQAILTLLIVITPTILRLVGCLNRGNKLRASIFYEFLDAFTEVRKTTVSFVVSFHPSVRMEQHGFFFLLLLLGLDH